MTTVKQRVNQELESQKLLLELAEVKRKYKELMKQNSQLQKDMVIVDGLKKPYKPTIIKATRTTGGLATAFMIASDWHIEEKVNRASVSGLNHYTLDIAQERADKFFQHGLTLLNICKRDVTIDTIVLALLGDFLSNTIHEELMESNQLMPADAIWVAQGMIASGIRFLLRHTDCKLVIPCTSGNHARLSKKQRHATEMGNSIEQYMYRNLALMFMGNERVKFVLQEGYHIYLKVYDKMIRFHHGHNIKYQGGVGGLSIPLNKAISQWDKAVRADLSVCGHWHQRKDFGNAMVNGSLIGYNAYAVSIKADYEKPQQTFFLLDRDRGKTIVAPILLD